MTLTYIYNYLKSGKLLTGIMKIMNLHEKLCNIAPFHDCNQSSVAFYQKYQEHGKIYWNWKIRREELKDLKNFLLIKISREGKTVKKSFSPWKSNIQSNIMVHLHLCCTFFCKVGCITLNSARKLKHYFFCWRRAALK